MDSDWRKIDIDALELESHLTKEDLIPTNISETTKQEIIQTSQEIRSYLSSGQFQQALNLGLDTVPYISSDETKEIHSKTIFEILCSIKNNNNLSDLKNFITELNDEQQDVLIKYLYKNMSTDYGQKQGGLLLQWFEKTVEITGVGPIARYLTDRRTV